ncbi:HEPN domain-containing protein [Pseudomonas sp. 14A]|uniref:ApeA N-terminal domain 1-containing protein n=1 Tax=Pseudomonas sp. 14A TaxID=2823142 RepID=UPI001B82C807|nr:HEPN domain-containing protein [Pseudomonas sp. 14A]MBR7197557.1 hypothetical protein [Pseudomonas sp. 14A]
MEVNDHGLFWWAGSEYTDGYAAGLLTIDASGIISLELHQTLPGRSGAEAIFRQELASEVGIVGCLKATGHYVLLKGLQTNGGRSGLISYENFTAEECFICQKQIDSENFTKLKVSLDGLQEWVRPGKVTCEGPLNNKISIELECNSTETWKTDTGHVELRHHFTGNKPSRYSSTLNVGLVSELTYTPVLAVSSQAIIEWYRAIQDLLLILTNCTLTLKWPQLIWSCQGDDLVVQYYFRRHEPIDNKIAWHQTLLPFSRIREIFGAMIDKWIIARKSLGPGINLYLGTRRNFRLYAEHRFVNLVWGLEALGRRSDPSESDETKVNEKIKKFTSIIRSVEGLNSGDRNWLKGLMKRSGERPLSERLFEELSPVAINIPDENLRRFCKRCADLRNDLSHHGGERMPGEYETFLAGILSNSEALSKLYLLVILRILGVSVDEIKRIMYRDPGSSVFKLSFVQAGLLPEDNVEQMLEPI